MARGGELSGDGGERPGRGKRRGKCWLWRLEGELGLPKAKVASSILAGGATAKTAKNNENTGRFRRFAWCGTAVGGHRFGTDCDAVGRPETRSVAIAWKWFWRVRSAPTMRRKRKFAGQFGGSDPRGSNHTWTTGFAVPIEVRVA